MTLTELDQFMKRMGEYLLLIGGPDGPTDSTVKPRSHVVLRNLYNDYGEKFVESNLAEFFKNNPKW